MKNIARLLLLAVLVYQTNLAHAAGFFVAEQSVSSLGTANAANTAGIEDASTTFSNPAGMVFLPNGNNTVIGGFLLIPSSHYHDKGTLNALGQPFPASSNGGNGGELALIPNIAYVNTIYNSLSFGITVNTPWGLTTEWNDEWYGRYGATHSEILTVNINPAIALKITECLSLGIGFNAMYFSTELRNMVDFGLLLSLDSVPGAIPEGQDGKACINGTTWSYGGNIGILFQPDCNTRVGIHYRSQQRINLDNGKIKYHFKNVPEEYIPALQQTFVNTKARTKITLPNIVSIGGLRRFNNCLEVMADAQWTNWSTIKNLKIKFKVPEETPSALEQTQIPLHWKDSWRFAVGVKYNFLPCLALRAGYAYDLTPTPNSFYRSPRLPDEDRQWLALGFNYKINETFSVDFAYAHIFFPTDALIDKRKAVEGEIEDAGTALAGGIYGKFHQRADIFGLSVNSNF